MRKTKPLPPREYLKECFEIDSSGNLIWRIRPPHHFKKIWCMEFFNRTFAGEKAGCAHKEGYISIPVLGSFYKAHRLIYYIFNGDLAYGDEVDHEDGNTMNNRPSNLRIATSSQNSQNTKVRSDNTLGIKGVWYCKSKKVFFAQVVKSKVKYIQKFSNVEDASEWIKKQREILHGEFANNGIHTGELK